MLLLRRILVLVLCCSVFLTVFVVPVSAVKLDEYAGVISIPPQSLGIRYNSLTEKTDWGYASVPVSFELSDDVYRFYYGVDTALTSVYSQVTAGGKDFEFIVSFGNGVGESVDVSFDRFRFTPYIVYDGYSPRARYYKFKGYCEIFADDELVYTSGLYDGVSGSDKGEFPSIKPRMTFSCSRYLRFVYHSTEDAVFIVDRESDSIAQVFDINMPGLTVNNQPAQLDRIEISIDNIETSIENIEEGVVNIEGTVTDMKEQLENPDSSIWDAAGEKISSSLEDLFVPSPEEIGAVKDGFDNLAKDKLGGAYSAMETVDDAVTDVTRKLHNPNPNVAIEFPGISVPLGGDVGIVTLAEEQPVTLPTELTAILHPVAGTIFSIICGLGTFNVLKDMVECFLSGYSYAAYLHRNKGGSDG